MQAGTVDAHSATGSGDSAWQASRAPAAAWCWWHPGTKRSWVCPQWLVWFGALADEVCPLSWLRARQEARWETEAWRAGSGSWGEADLLLVRDRAGATLALQVYPLQGDADDPRQHWTLVDVAGWRQAELALQVSWREAERARQLFEAGSRLALMGSWEMPVGGEEVFWSESTYRMHEVEVGTPISLDQAVEFYRPAHRARVAAAVAHTIETGEPFQFEAEIGTRLGRSRWVTANGELVRDGQGQPVAVRGAVRDITEEYLQREQLRHQAGTDQLTGLPNRRAFMEALEAQLTRTTMALPVIGVMLIDLDRFKEINDSLGHDTGDRFLQIVAQRIAALLGRGHVLARLGGDEFAVVTAPVSTAGFVVALAHELAGALEEPFWPEGIEYHCGGSVGVALFPLQAQSASELMRRADIAMYAAKGDAAHRVCVFTEEMGLQARRQLHWHTRLSRAVREGQFVLHYQPRVCLRTGAITGLEALARWEEGGTLVPPDEFIPMAERTGLIGALGEWVIRQALDDLVRVREQGQVPWPVAINISSRQFRQPGLSLFLEEQLALRGLPARLVEVEITESLFVDPGPLTRQHLERLRAMGVRISLDDFGAGYSSFAYLQNFGLQALKIDRQFVTDASSHPQRASILRTMLLLARTLGLHTVAEGVESEATLALLRTMECDEYQGFLFARPMPLDQILARFAGAGEARAGVHG